MPSSMQGWLDETAESLKSLDPNHLVTYSSEGFLGSSTPGEADSESGASSQHRTTLPVSICHQQWLYLGRLQHHVPADCHA